MLRREMRPKRESLPPKEGDLTCMQVFQCTPKEHVKSPSLGGRLSLL